MSTSRSKVAGFSQHQVDTAVLVAMSSKSVKNWVDGIAKAYGVNKNTVEGREFYDRETRAAAMRLLDLD